MPPSNILYLPNRAAAIKTLKPGQRIFPGLLICATLLCITPNLHAHQPNREPPAEPLPTSIFGFEIFPGLVRSSPNHRFLFSLNLLAGKSYGSYILEIGTLANIASGEVYGLQIAGLANYNNTISGLQIGGLFNVSRKVTGAQIGFINMAGDVAGLQIGGHNFIAHSFSGLQLSAANTVEKTLFGLQLAIFVNEAHHAYGTQLAPVNISNTINGLQLGLINYAKTVHGLQIGLINIASPTAASIGLINISDQNTFDLELSASEDGLATLGLRHQASALYNTYFVGTRLTNSNDFTPAAGLGIGWHTSITPNFEFSIDTTTTLVLGPTNDRSKINILQKLRPLITWQPTQRFALFAGPTLTLQFIATHSESFAPINSSNITDHTALWPGLTLGTRLSL